jgi:hypothetical protein
MRLWETAGNATTLTENHGVPGSIPGPATPKSAAKRQKRRSPVPSGRHCLTTVGRQSAKRREAA